MKTSFDRKLIAGYGISVFLLIVVGFFSWRVLSRLLESNDTVEHTHNVIARLESLSSLIKDAETGQRGYLLTGKKQFLEPYNGAYDGAVRITNELQNLTKDNSRQQKNIEKVEAILLKRLTILKELINKKGSGLQINNEDLDASKAAMDAFRNAVAKAELEERQLLQKRTDNLRWYNKNAPVFIIGAILMGIVLATYSYINIIRDIRQKDKLRNEVSVKEQETAAINEELTAANEEITAANEELTAVNEELLEAREELFAAKESLEHKVAERTKALTESEEETQALNEELTAMNEELAATNEELLTTNEELAKSQDVLQQTIEDLQVEETKSAKLAAIVESSDDAIIGKTLDGIITSWNKAAERIFGYTDEEMIGQSIMKLIPEERADEEPAIISRIRNGEHVEHFETQRRTKEGVMLDLSLTISPIRNKEGSIIGVSKTARDISEKKRDEQRKNDFIGMASHELKTPLTSLNALLQVMQVKARAKEDVFFGSALEKATRQSRKMVSLINGFLNVSRLEAGKLEILPQRFDLVELIHEIVDEARLSISGHELKLQCSDVRLIDADREKIGAVISNLISNAVKYSPRGKIVNIACAVAGDQVQVSVQDEGMGIKPEHLEKLFDRYYRVESEHTKQISGFGVGLYLSSEIINRHEGSIWAESEKGVGSTFYFTLPLA